MYATEETANVMDISSLKTPSPANRKWTGKTERHSLVRASRVQHVYAESESELLNTGKYKLLSELACKSEPIMNRNIFQPCRHSRIRLGKKKLNFIIFSSTHACSNTKSSCQKGLFCFPPLMVKNLDGAMRLLIYSQEITVLQIAVCYPHLSF